jgi:PAS domain S-box-containing protein
VYVRRRIEPRQAVPPFRRSAARCRLDSAEPAAGAAHSHPIVVSRPFAVSSTSLPPVVVPSLDVPMFRAVAESIPQLVWSTTPDGYHDYYNERWYDYTGMPREGAQGWNWKNFLHADDYDRAAEAWSRSLATGEPYEIEYRVKRAADGMYRWFIGRALPMRDAGGRIVRWFGTCTDIDDHRRREAVLGFLAESGAALASSLEVETTLAAAARLAVPRLADWAAIDVREPDGTLRRLAVAHVDPEKVRLAHELQERYPPHPDDPHGVPHVLRTGQPELVPEIPDALLVAMARDEEHLALARALKLCSYIVAPLTVQGRTVGAFTLVSAESARRFDEEDLGIALEFARRASAALENAQLYEESVRTQERLEQQAAELELQNEQLQEQSVELEMQAAQLQEQAVELSAANDTLLSVNAALRESERRLTLALEGGGLAWWEWDIGAGVIRWSPQLEGLLGLEPGAFDGTMAGYLRHVHPDDQPALLATVEGTIARRDERYEVRHRMLRADGAVLWVHAFARLVCGDDGQPVRLLGIVMDVSAAVQAEHDRLDLLRREQAARREAEQANHAKADFLATMSHELRTPLNAIAGYTDLLSMGVRGPVGEEQLEDLRRIKKSAQHLLSLINDILNFARLEAGQVELRIGRVPMHETLASVEALVAPQVRERGLRYTYAGCEDGVAARADAEKVQQILLNLLTNAVKFTDAGGEVRVACGDGDGRVWVEVADTGRGIPADRLDTIFEPFVQIDRHLTHESQQGVGLGLAISRDLARAMGGDLTATSAPGVGSTFRLTLPAE